MKLTSISMTLWMLLPLAIIIAVAYAIWLSERIMKRVDEYMSLRKREVSWLEAPENDDADKWKDEQ